MKILVIYYSKTGNTKLIAETMAQKLNADILSLKPKREIKSNGFLLLFRGGFQSMIKKKIKLEKIELNYDDYDLFLIGTPVWAWRLNPVVRSFLKEIKFKDKKIGLFCCRGGSGKNIFDDMSSILEGNKILDSIEFIEPLKYDKDRKIEQAKQWAQEILNKAL